MQLPSPRAPIRLLTFLKEVFQGKYSTKQLRWLVEHHRCRINGKVERFCSTSLKAGDRVTLILDFPAEQKIESKRIIYEDNWLFAYNKSAAQTSEEVSALTGYKLAHRLDRDTTGLLLLAKDSETENALTTLFKERRIKKTYLAWVSPPPKSTEGVISFALVTRSLNAGAVMTTCHPKGKEAITHWKLKKKVKDKALLELSPETGRTHQIRVHLKAIGSPIIGDILYGSRHQKALRPLLHAFAICFLWHDHVYNLEAPLPEDFY